MAKGKGYTKIKTFNGNKKNYAMNWNNICVLCQLNRCLEVLVTDFDNMLLMNDVEIINSMTTEKKKYQKAKDKNEMVVSLVVLTFDWPKLLKMVEASKVGFDQVDWCIT